jgi:hypothetical protein
MKNFILHLTLLITLSLSGWALAADNDKCIYPSPDGYSLDSSPPTVKGKIVKIEPNAIFLKPESSSKPDAVRPLQIKIDNKTRIFALSGGYDARSELTPGQDAYIWYKGCRLPKKGQLPYAAVVKIDTKLPDKK